MTRVSTALLAVGLLAGCGAATQPATTSGATGATPSAARSPAPAGADGANPEGAVQIAPGPSRPPTSIGPGQPSVVASGLRAPWGLAFLPDGEALVSERDTGRVLRVSPNGAVTDVGRLDVADAGEGGLLGLALSPSYATDSLVYAYLSAPEQNAVVRFRYDGSRIGAPEPVLAGLPHAAIHNGGRIVFGPDGLLYVGTGDASDGARAQDLDYLGGKILRVTPEGKVPPSNPFPGSPVYSLGHRNVQGLAFDDAGRLWASEFGQNRFDELNLIVAGGNYGWPLVEGTGGGERFRDPVVTWQPAQASPSGLAFAQGSLWVAALRGQRLWQVPLSGATAGTPQPFLVEEYGRLRHAALAPDGSLWVLTSNRDGRGNPAPSDDRILRVPLVARG